MREYYKEQLHQLEIQLTAMVSMCQKSVYDATKALTEGDIALAEEVMKRDFKVNEQEREIENLCLKLLLHQQPVASDLRNVSASLKLITDLERIGDQAADIAEIVLKAGLKLPEEFQHLCNMGTLSISMISDGWKSYVDRDLELARAVIEADDEMDAWFVKIRGEILSAIRENHADGAMALDLFMITKYYERIGDHAVNVAEWVEYALTGVHRRNY